MIGTHSQLLDLDKRPALVDLYGDDKRYLNVEGVYDKTFSYGKHTFYVSYADYPDSPYRLKESTQILFEVKDIYGTVIYSGNTEHTHVNGSSISYFYIKQDPLRTDYDIANGPGTLTLMAELEGVPVEWQNTFNLKLTIPFHIRKNYVNNSDIVFLQEPVVDIANYSTVFAPSEHYGGNYDTQRNFDVIAISHMETYGGEVKYLDVHYRHSSSVSASMGEWTPLGTFDIDWDSELLTRHTYKHRAPFKAGWFGSHGNVEAIDIDQNWPYSGTSPMAGSPGVSPKYQIDSNINLPDGITLIDGYSKFNIFRKTTSTEQFRIRMNVSGALRFGIYSSPVLEDLTKNDGGRHEMRITSTQNNWSSSVSQSVFCSYNKDITPKFGEFSTKPPTVDFLPVSRSIGADGETPHWDEFSFTIPSGSWVMLGIGANAKGLAPARSGSIGKISIKHQSVSGTNPPQFYFHSDAVHNDFRHTPYEHFEYKVNFLNHEKIPALNIASNDYPIVAYQATDKVAVSASQTTFATKGLRKGVIMANYGTQSESTINWNNNTTLQVYSGPSGSEPFQYSSLGTYGIVSTANADWGQDDRVHNNRVITPLLTNCYPITTQEDSLQQKWGNSYTGTMWTAQLMNGDVNINKNLAIGSFLTYEHPSESLHVKGNALIEGDLTAKNYIVSSSVTHMTTSFKSGSTMFGDSMDDTHKFTGSFDITGTVSASSGYAYQPYIHQILGTNTTTAAGGKDTHEFLSGTSPGIGSISHSITYDTVAKKCVCTYGGIYEIGIRSQCTPQDVASNLKWVVLKNNVMVYQTHQQFFHIINSQGLQFPVTHVLKLNDGDSVKLMAEASGTRVMVSSSYTIKRIS